MDVEEAAQKAARPDTFAEERSFLHPEPAFAKNEGVAFAQADKKTIKCSQKDISHNLDSVSREFTNKL